MTDPKHLAPSLRRTTSQRLRLVVGVVLVTVLVAGASVVGYLNYRFNQLTRFDVATDVVAAGEPRNYLIVGSDSRAGLDENDPENFVFFDDTISADGAQRTDTIMILRVDPGENKASLMSLPRDLFVPIADTGDRNRINVAYTRGRDVLIDTIRENFGIPIHHYIEIDFVGFIGLVDAIDGVPMYFDSPVRDSHSGLLIEDAGCVRLDPRQSLSFARSRYLQIYDDDTGKWKSDPTGDLGRITRQQEFIRKAISRAVSKGLSNPATLNSLVSVAVDSVGLDPGLDASDILRLGTDFADFDSETLQTYSVPTTPFRTSAGAEVLELVERDAEPILNIFRGREAGDISPEIIEVTVLNGTDKAGFAGQVTDAVEAVGFSAGTPGDTDEPEARSTLFVRRGDEDYARVLMRYLSSTVAVAFDDDLDPGEVVLVAGADFTTVHDQPSPSIPEITTTTTTVATVDGTSPSTSTSSTTAPVGYLPDDPAAACV